MPDFKLLPMGISDFRRIRRENYYYVDKTEWIPKFELVSSFLFFCRPRRFGKTLMLSLMESYYDCKQQQDWDWLFSGFRSYTTMLFQNQQYLMHQAFRAMLFGVFSLTLQPTTGSQVSRLRPTRVRHPHTNQTCFT